MEPKECPMCGIANSGSSLNCKHCKHEFTDPNAKKIRVQFIIKAGLEDIVYNIYKASKLSEREAMTEICLEAAIMVKKL